MRIRLLAALLLSAIAPQAAAQTVNFNVGGVDITMPIPQGFCEPKSPEQVALAEGMGGLDWRNETLLTLFSCETVGSVRPDFLVVKARKATLTATITRKQMLDTMVAEVSKDGAQAQLDAGTRVMGVAATMLAQTKIEMLGKLRWLKIDETCAYLGGVIKVQGEQVSSSRSASGCITAVGGRALFVTRYSEGVPDNVFKHLPLVKAVAQSMTAATPN